MVTQRLTSNHFVLDDGRVNSYPVEGRYAWPSELDLMARLAGTRLREGGWKRKPFTSLSHGPQRHSSAVLRMRRSRRRVLELEHQVVEVAVVPVLAGFV